MANINSRIKSRYSRYSTRIKSRNSAFVRNGKICDARHVAFGGASFNAPMEIDFITVLDQKQAA